MGGGGPGVSRFRRLAVSLWLAAERALDEEGVKCISRESFYDMSGPSGQACLGDPVAL